MTEGSAHAQANWCSTLRELISRCEEDVLVFRSEASSLNGGGGQLGKAADERNDWANELGHVLDRMQGRRSTFGMPVAGLLVRYRQFRRAFIGANRGDSYEICIKSAERTEAVYRAALETDLPPQLVRVVERHCDLVSSGREDLVESQFG